MRTTFIYLDGKILSADTAFIESLAPGNISGVGVFETMRSYDGKIFAFDEHFTRFKKGLQICNVENGRGRSRLKTSLNSFKKSAHDLLKKNHLKEARVRMAVWKDHKQIHSVVVALPFKPYSSRDRRRGFKAILSNDRCDETKTHPDLKSINCALYLKAFNQAKARAADEAILLNQKGMICEGSRSNIFYIKNGVMATPPLSAGCLNGITRQIVLKLLGQQGIVCRQINAGVKDFLEADEAFLTNSLIEIMPLTNLEGRPIASGKPGRTTLDLLQHYRKLI